jgi:hypothetical protein
MTPEPRKRFVELELAVRQLADKPELLEKVRELLAQFAAPAEEAPPESAEDRLPLEHLETEAREAAGEQLDANERESADPVLAATGQALARQAAEVSSGYTELLTQYATKATPTRGQTAITQFKAWMTSLALLWRLNPESPR